MRLKPKRVLFKGVGVSSITMSETMAQFDQMVASSMNHYVSFIDANLYVCILNDSIVELAVKKASLVLPDGAGLMVASRMLGDPLKERLVGPNVMFNYCKHASKMGRTHFFYGGNEGVAELLAQRLIELIPDIKIVGTFCPPFRPLTSEEDLKVKYLIEQSGADVLWVGLGAPKQDLWIADHLSFIDVPLMLGVGAAYDYLSGTKKRAPAIMQKMGLEWLHRISTQGRRIIFRSAKILPVFIWEIIKQTYDKRIKQSTIGVS